MTRVDLDYVESFEFVTDDELSAMIQEAAEVPELVLEPADILGENDLEGMFDLTEEQWQSELDQAFEDATTPVNRIARGVAYCENVQCNDYLKGCFLFMHEGAWKCATCKESSDHLIPEQGIPDRDGQVPFSTVRVEYCYEPASKRYTEIVQLSDEEYTGPSGVYTLQSPLVKTPVRAAKMAESLLTIINEGVILDDDLSEAPKSHERILSFDKPADEFRKDLEALEHRLRDNSFLQRPSVFTASSEVELNLEEGDSSGPQSNPASRTTDSHSGVSSRGDQRAGALPIHDRRQPGGVRPQRSEGRLYPVQSVGTHSEDLHRATREGRRSRSHRQAPSKLRAAAGRLYASLLRSTGRGSASGT